MPDSNPSRQPYLYSLPGVKTLLLHVDDQREIVYANSAFLRYFGIQSENIVGRPLEVLGKAGKPALTRAILEALPEEDKESRIEDNSGNHFVLRLNWKNGEAFFAIEETSEQERLRSLVRQYISAEWEDLSEQDQATFRFPERRFMTVGFSDLRGFTSLSEELPPEEIRTLINAYLETALRAVDKNQATVDKIVGDEVVVLFGAPRYFADHALRAVVTALDQQASLQSLQEEFRRHGKEMPPCGIGINTGEMVVGNIGTESRLDYTVMGASVNLASRLCGDAKGGQILISRATLEALLKTLPSNWEAWTQDKNGGRRSLEGFPESHTSPLGHQPLWVGEREKPFCRFVFSRSLQLKGIREPVEALEVIPEDGFRKTHSEFAPAEPAPGTPPTTEEHTRERTFGRYRLVEMAGRGGMAEVWKARDSFGNDVAIKMLLSTGSQDHRRRFLREAEIMKNLDHSSICRIREVGKYERTDYIAMDFIQGVTIDTLMTAPVTRGTLDVMVDSIRKLRAKPGEMQMTSPTVQGMPKNMPLVPVDSSGPSLEPLGIQHALRLMESILSAIQYAHEHGIIHRDLKPANIMVKPNGIPVVMDFGLGRFEQAEHSVTMSVQVVGTIDFMSPEQAHSARAADERSDVFSAGALLYYLLTGEKWFPATGNILADAATIEKREVESPAKLNRKIPRDLDTIVRKAMEKEPGRRYASARSFREDLERFRRDEPVAARPAGILYRTGKIAKRHAVPIAISVVAGLLILLSAFLYSTEKIKEMSSWGEPVFTENFESPDWSKRWYARSGSLGVANGELVSARGNWRECSITLKRRFSVPCAMQMQIRMKPDCRPADLSVLWVSDTARGSFDTEHFLFQVGARTNRMAAISRWMPHRNQPSVLIGAETELSIEPGRNYTLRGEVYGKELRLFLDGKLLCRHQDEFIFPYGHFGIYAFNEGKVFDNVQVYALGVAEKVSILEIGNAFFRKRFYPEAIMEFERIQKSHAGSEVAETARSRMASCYSRMGKHDVAESLWATISSKDVAFSANLMRAASLFRRGKVAPALQITRSLLSDADDKEKATIRRELDSWIMKSGSLPLANFFERTFPDHPQTPQTVAQALLKAGKYNEILERYPHDPLICSWALVGLRRYGDVLKRYPEIRDQCAKSLYALQRYEELVDHYQDQRLYRARALYQLGRYREVLDTYPELYRISAWSLLRLGHPEDVLKKFPGVKDACEAARAELAGPEKARETAQ